MKQLAILGASGHGKVVADAALRLGWADVVFYDDRWPQRRLLGPWLVVGTTQELLEAHADIEAAIVAIGDNRVRLAKYLELSATGIRMLHLVHPSAVVSTFAEVGAGSIVVAGGVVNAFAVIGAACIVNTGATVDHDCVLADGVHVSPGAHLGGDVRVGEASWIGIGASIRNGISIGANVIIGAGASVVDDVPDSVTVVGVPARPITLFH